ncbi:glycoside hydrolase family 1 protein [Pedosphaera parvula]|uniref:Glycoside hydrolase family 1 n=1 Tax=Pedosphaera parvula (strain Ellin514) TaxID=320771 RepID=B9XR93_PEDPL|nr:family 1 glycosylhydrolase [Pedosphaera parvula]EEF57636.1 glycoside hydrolase family 1 [Pedosphaera parvula Ellin514]
MSLDDGSGLIFPQNFLWGTATATTQVEGHIENEWTDFVAQDGSTCRIACDNYHRYPEDIDWMSKLGTNAYRFGIEWSRLQTRPFGELNRKELARYVDMIDGLRGAGIRPMVVLHHFSNPLWIHAQGGWTTRATVAAFTDYVTKLVMVLKDKVDLWNTFNEPDTYASLAYVLGGFPPRENWQLIKFRKIIQNMASAHEEAGHIIKHAGSPLRPMQVGIAKNWTFFHAFKKLSPWDRLIAFACHSTFNKFVLRSFLGGARREASTFLGLNYYGRVRFHHFDAMIPASGTPSRRLKDFGFVCDDMVERYPQGLGYVLNYLHHKHRLPIYITEHGAASKDEAFREADLISYLKVLHGAIQEGVDVRGFFYWSLLDNFEWQFGYAKKFGLIEVDFDDPNLARTMKPLGEVYQKICRSNACNLHETGKMP